MQRSDTNSPVAYLSGPMTGYVDDNFPAFHEAAENLRDFGLVVINPAENVGGHQDMTAEWFLGLDITMIVTRADMVVVLPGWERSRGAKLEVLVANAVGLPVYEYNGRGWEKFGDPLGAQYGIRDYTVHVTLNPGPDPEEVLS